MTITYGTVITAFAADTEPAEATFEAITAPRVRVLISVAGPGTPVDVEVWDRTTGESVLVERKLGMEADTKHYLTLDACTALKVTAYCRDAEGRWSNVGIALDYAQAPAPKALVPTRYRKYPNKTHRHRRSVSLRQPKLADTLGPLTAGLINLPVESKRELAQAVAALVAVERLAVQPEPLAPVQPVIIKEPLLRRVHKMKYDKHGDVDEIETVEIPIQEAKHGD